MGNSKINLYIPIIFFLLLSPASVLGQETETPPRIPVAAEGNFVLSVENDRLSLKAKEASLKTILREIGQKMGVEVVGEISPQEIITTEFYDLSLEQALHNFGPNYGYQMNTGEGEQKIVRIFILPQGRETGDTSPKLPGPQTAASAPPSNSQEFEEPSEPEISERPHSFKFELDPTALMDK